MILGISSLDTRSIRAGYYKNRSYTPYSGAGNAGKARNTGKLKKHLFICISHESKRTHPKSVKTPLNQEALKYLLQTTKPYTILYSTFAATFQNPSNY